MADTTYVRVTMNGTVLAGESGTWIPVTASDLTVGTSQIALSFSLAQDDAIINLLNSTGYQDTPALKVEVATYDPTTASASSAGTLVSYAVSTNAVVSQQAVDPATGATSYKFAASNISQTTYPPTGPASSASFDVASGSVAPTAVPADVVTGGSVANSTSAAPDPSGQTASGLTYYMQFATAQGTYVPNGAGGTWFKISDLSTGFSRSETIPAGTDRFESGQVSVSDLSFKLADISSAEAPLLQNQVSSTGNYAVHIEAVAGIGTSAARVVDSTTYEQPIITYSDGTGDYGVNSTGFYSEHFGASGQVISSSGLDLATDRPDTGASKIAASLPPSDLTSGEAIDKSILVVSGAAGVIGKAGVAITAPTFTITSTPQGNAAHREPSAPSQAEYDTTSTSQDAEIYLDPSAFVASTGPTYTINDYIGGTLSRSFALSDTLVSGLSIDLVSGEHDYSFNYTKSVLTSHPKAGPSSGAAAPQSAAPAGTSYVQFRDPTTNDVVSSSTGQQWFAIASASIGVGRGISTPGTGDAMRTISAPSLSELSFSLGQDAVTGTLDNAIVSGQALTTEVATYGANGALQTDYVLGQGVITDHSDTAGSDAQSFDFKTKTFQETQYDDSGAMLGTFNYDTSTNALASAARSNAGATAPTTTNAQPQALDTYVQFVGSNGMALTDGSGSSWFKIAGTSSGFSDVGGKTTLGDLALAVGNNDIATQLDTASLTQATLSNVNVSSYTAGGSFVSYQRYSGATIDADGADNTGGDHAYSFTYQGYGERIAGTALLNASTATAGTTQSADAPSATDAIAPANVGATTAPSLSTLAYYGELKTGGTEAFADTSSGFVTLPDFSIDLAGSTASFQVDQTQAAALENALFANNPDHPTASFEIAGYNSSGRSIDYVLTGVGLGAVTTDTASGLSTIGISYKTLQETQTVTPATSRTAMTGAAQTIDAPQDAPPAVCFASGTLMTTHRGAVAVEALAVGDYAVTASGAHRPIRWLGHRVVDCRRHPRPLEVMPVRIAAHAFGENRPSRDLRVSPEHSLCVDVVDAVLIPACRLVNGSTIAYDACDSVVYWHVELDSHDILLAEGMPAESFLEMGANRALLGLPADGAAADDLSDEALARTHADFCRPFHQAGPIVEIVRAQLAARAERLGWQASRDVGLVATADGRPLAIQTVEGQAFVAVPDDVAVLCIDSATFTPATFGEADTRRLGIALYGMEAVGSDGTTRVLDLDGPALAASFHAGERREGLHYRWTDGALNVPGILIADLVGPIMLRLSFEPSTVRGWIAPEQIAARPALRVVA